MTTLAPPTTAVEGKTWFTFSAIVGGFTRLTLNFLVALTFAFAQKVRGMVNRSEPLVVLETVSVIGCVSQKALRPSEGNEKLVGKGCRLGRSEPQAAVGGTF